MTRKSREYAGCDLEAMSAAPNYIRWVCSYFQPWLAGSVCEVGAGTGNFTRCILNPRITRLLALEPSAAMHGILQSRLATDTRAETQCNFLGEIASRCEKSFDTVCYFSVLEHIDQPHQELSVARSVLKDSGHLCIFVPALPILYSAFDRSIGHLRRYTRSQLVRHVEHAGYDIVWTRYIDMLGIIPWFISIVLLRQHLHKSTTALFDRIVVPLSRAIESRVHAVVGKNLVCAAKRKN